MTGFAKGRWRGLSELLRRGEERPPQDLVQGAVFAQRASDHVSAVPEAIETHPLHAPETLGVSAIAAGAGVGTGVVVGEVDLVGGLRGLPAAGARQRVAKIGPVRVEPSRRLQLRELPIPAMVPDRGDGGG